MNSTTDAPVFCPAPRNFKVVVKNLKLPAAAAPVKPVVASGKGTTSSSSKK